MKAKGISNGIGIGTALVLEKQKPVYTKETIEDSSKEWTRFEDTINVVVRELENLKKKTELQVGIEEAMIFDAHMEIAKDPEILKQVKDLIEKDHYCAQWALLQTTDGFISIFETMEDVYLKERAHDIKDVRTRILNRLQGIETIDLAQLENDTILIAEDLTPSETAEMDKERVKGIITITGGETSHSAILARTLEIPAISGAIDIMEAVSTGDIVAVNGNTGFIEINPEIKRVEEIQIDIEKQASYKKALQQMVGLDTQTKDGKHFELAANIGGVKDIENVLANDGEGIGLFRSEFLYMDRSGFPSEDEQFDAYSKVLSKMGEKPVVIRTLDIGGDKHLDYFEFPQEMNPFLGYRAIRLCLDREDIFKTQLRALYRASASGNLKIMFPMISSLKELRKAKALCKSVQNELKAEGIEFKENVELGIMIEIPAAAILSDQFAKEVDFMSIGTNDLIQYTTAVDRMNHHIADLYTPYHPALLRLVKTVIENGHKEGIWVGMCGEVAGNPLLIPLLAALGLDEFSMTASRILEARQIIRSLKIDEMGQFIEDVFSLGTADDVKFYLEKYQQK